MFGTRAYTAFAITPQPPIVEWLADLDANLTRSNGFFAGHPVALDPSQVRLSPAAIATQLGGWWGKQSIAGLLKANSKRGDRFAVGAAK